MKDLTDELGNTVGKYLPHDLSDPLGTSERKRAAFACDDVDKRKKTAEHLGNDGCLRGTVNAHVHNADEKVIQEKVDRCGEKVDRKTDLRSFSGGQKALENVLENIKWKAEDEDAAVIQTHRKHLFVCTHKLRKRRQKDLSENRKDKSADDGNACQGSEVAARFFLLSAGKFLRDDRGTAASDHVGKSTDEKR